MNILITYKKPSDLYQMAVFYIFTFTTDTSLLEKRLIELVTVS